MSGNGGAVAAYKCPYCKRDFKVWVAYRRHIAKHRKEGDTK